MTTPIDPQNYIAGPKVIDFGDARVSRGKSRRPHSSCNHLHLSYDTQERRIVCDDCNTELEAFDGFKALIDNYHGAMSRLDRARDEVIELQAQNIISVAAKKLDKVWRGKTMAPCCPHCNRGLLPEDFSQGIKQKVSREFERKGRERDAHRQRSGGGA